VLYRYAFRNAMLPVVTTIGMVFSFMLGSNVLVEKVFAWPGIGSFAVDALVAVRLRAGAGLRAGDGDALRDLNLDDRHRSTR
jgi:ABC-type antimicrobial peptide transport system permease subunit